MVAKFSQFLESTQCRPDKISKTLQSVSIYIFLLRILSVQKFGIYGGYKTAQNGNLEGLYILLARGK